MEPQKTLDQIQLNKVLTEHSRWLQDDANHKPAELANYDLRNLDFGNSIVTYVDLRGSHLAGADLSESQGLSLSQLAGADLTGTKLPKIITDSNIKDRTNHLAGICRTTYISIATACLYCWLVIATTTDAALVINGLKTELPIIGVDINIAHFYLVAPLILYALFSYFMICTQQLWSEISELPAIFPDGRTVIHVLYPWLPIALARLFIPLLATTRKKSISHLFNILPLILTVWVPIPITLVMFWWRYTVAHDPFISVVQISLVSLSWAICVGYILYCMGTLKGMLRYRPATKYKQPHPGRRTWAAVTWSSSLLAGFVAFALMGYQSSLALANGKTPLNHGRFLRMTADLDFVDLSLTDAIKVTNGELSLLSTNNLSGVNAKNAKFNYRNLTRMNIRHAQLSNSQFSGVILIDGQLQGSNLEGARFDGAKMTRVNLINAEANQTDFSRATLINANMSNARLIRAKLDGANLANALLVDSDLRTASLVGTDAPGANFTEAVLIGADLSKALLQKANFTDADLTQAKFTQANLTQTNFTGAVLVGADLSGVVGEIIYNDDEPPCIDENTQIPQELGWQNLPLCGRESLLNITRDRSRLDEIQQRLAAASVANGERLFEANCGNCHSAAAGVIIRGPSLNSVYCSRSGTNEQFAENYSDTLRNGMYLWDDLAIDDYLRNPQLFASGNRMGFPGFGDDEEKRANIIVYLKSLSSVTDSCNG